MKVIINYQEYPDVAQERALLEAEFDDIQIIESHTREAAEFIREAEGVEGALIQFAPITREVIDALPACRGYVRYGIGYDNIDAEYAARKGKQVANVQTYCIDEVSNHAVALLLALNRNLVRAHELVRANQYSLDGIRPVHRLADCTLGIVGLGNIGKRFADKMQSMVRRIVFFDPYVDGHGTCQKMHSLAEVFATSDAISLHPLLNAETRHLVTGELLARMKPTAYLVNTSRGPVIDQKALIDILRRRRIAGAGLDVFEVEPLPADSPLRSLDNVILSHHSAWYSEGAIQELQRKGAEQLVQILKGQTPEYSVI